MKKPVLLILVCCLCFSCSKDDDLSTPLVVSKTQEKEKDSDTDKDVEIIDPNLDPELTNNVVYNKDFIVFEPQFTRSSLGLWKIRKKGDLEFYESSDKSSLAPINNDYLEFTGNNLNSGPPKSPLSYTFKAPRTGKFRIVMRMLQPLKKTNSNPDRYEAEDKRNDLWIRLEGSFTTACRYPTEILKKNKKFWGRGVRKWGSIIRLEAHVNGSKLQQKVVYNFTKGENYKLTISGRAQGCSIDYILFYDEAVISPTTIKMHIDPAKALPSNYRPIETIEK